jgi:hypothetical protein
MGVNKKILLYKKLYLNKLLNIQKNKRKMKLIDNKFASFRHINGFSKEKVLELKHKISDFKKSENDEDTLQKLLEKIFPEEILTLYMEYIENIENFFTSYIKKIQEDFLNGYADFFHLNSTLLEEINLLYQNLSNLSLNIQNTQRFLRDNELLQEYSTKAANLQEKLSSLRDELKTSLGKTPKKYNDTSLLFSEINTIKNSVFSINQLPEECLRWEEISEFVSFTKTHGKVLKEKGILSKKRIEILFEFNHLSDYFKGSDSDVKKDLIFLLFKNDFLKELEGQEYPTDLGKDIESKLKGFMNSVIKEWILDELDHYIKEVRALEKKKGLETKKGEQTKEDIDNLIGENLNSFLPKFVGKYIQQIEQTYKLESSRKEDINQLNITITEYSNKIDQFYTQIEHLKNHLNYFKSFLKPYSYLMNHYIKVFTSLLDNIDRKKDDFVYYIKTIKKEWLKDELRIFINGKTDEMNHLLANYRDELAVILEKQFPEFKQMEDILTLYQNQIKKIKEQVHQKLTDVKEKNLNQLQIIQKWEKTYNRTKKQASFLLTQYILKVFKNFEGIIEKEDALFNRLAEISHHDLGDQELPLNYALSGYLFDKLSQSELRERIQILHDKINQLQNLQNLYKSEITKIEEIIDEKIKIKEGISSTNVQCVICHKNIDLKKDKTIKCSFCGAFFHYLCIYFWLSEYNSCPACQNAFLDPNNNVFEFIE